MFAGACELVAEAELSPRLERIGGAWVAIPVRRLISLIMLRDRGASRHYAFGRATCRRDLDAVVRIILSNCPSPFAMVLFEFGHLCLALYMAVSPFPLSHQPVRPVRDPVVLQLDVVLRNCEGLSHAAGDLQHHG